MNLNKNNVRVVLVGTTHPGNIGATARAMKTMAQKELYLVNPKTFPSAEATARATGADDILSNAKIYDDLKSAISDCDLVIATSARVRSISWPLISPRSFVEKMEQNDFTSVAIVFGRESSGLTNEEIELCNYVIKIPTSDEYNSLNLAAAVQIICYELFILNEDISVSISDNEDEALVDHEKMEQFYSHLEESMVHIGYLDKKNPGLLMHRLRRLFNRALVKESEWRILRGFLSKIYKN
ncbi:MAG: RNA methyltransferase [Proteobacteria bacterium]|nr:RNA methyltransferase [Pseudomonadota bacterium]